MGRKPKVKKAEKPKKTKTQAVKAQGEKKLMRAYPVNKNGVMVFPAGMHPRDIRKKREEELNMA